MLPLLDYLHGSEDPNPGPHAYAASTLLTELSSQPDHHYFY